MFATHTTVCVPAGDGFQGENSRVMPHEINNAVRRYQSIDLRGIQNQHLDFSSRLLGETGDKSHRLFHAQPVANFMAPRTGNIRG